MNTQIKDWVQVLSWGVAIIGGLIAAFKAIAEMRENREQRVRELRWKQATAAKEFFDEILADSRVNDALQMLDWSGRDYKIDEDTVATITSEDVWYALRTTNLKFTEKETYIRDCFDRLLYSVERIEQSISIGLFNFEDVQYPLEYYARKLRSGKKREAFEGFLRSYGYVLAKRFFYRFESWNSASDGGDDEAHNKEKVRQQSE
jgi:hypothetical protein